MRWLTARSSDYSRLVCDLCHEDALDRDSDRRVGIWDWYWHDTPKDDYTWQEVYRDDEEGPRRSPARPPTHRVEGRNATEVGRGTRPSSSSDSLAELVARREQLLAARPKSGGASPTTEPRLTEDALGRGRAWLLSLRRRVRRRFE